MEDQKEDLIDFFSSSKFEANEIIENKIYLVNEVSYCLNNNLENNRNNKYHYSRI